MATQLYEDRADAGLHLADALTHLSDEEVGDEELVVVGLARGGMPVAFEVARRLDAPLDVMIVRKLGSPNQPELALGAITSGGVRVLNSDIVARLGLDEAMIEEVADQQKAVIERCERDYRGEQPPIDPAGKTVVLVDDGLATGASMRAAVQGVRAAQAARIFVAVPVAAPASHMRLEDVVDQFVCPLMPDDFRAVSQHYRRFEQVDDDQVRQLLRRARQGDGHPPRHRRQRPTRE